MGNDTPQSYFSVGPGIAGGRIHGHKLVLQQDRNSTALVSVRAAQSVRGVGTNRVQDGIAPVALAHLARQLSKTGPKSYF